MSNQLIRKTLPANLAVKSIDEEGWFEGYASTFGNADLVGDIFQKGAFRRTLAHRAGAGSKVPILLNHQKDLICGYNYDAREDDHGLWVKGRLNLNTDAGRTAHFLLKSAQEAGGEGGLSIGFTVPSGGAERIKSSQGMLYKEVAWREYSVTPWNCNPEALVTSVKNHEELPERTKTLSLPAITIEQAIKASQGEDRNLTPEQLAGLLAFSEIISATKSEPIQTETTKEPPVAETQTKETATGPITFEAALANQAKEELMREERWKLESALSEAIGSICESDMQVSEKKLAVSRAFTSYAQAMSDWYGASLESTQKSIEQVLAIKGMNTSEHVSYQKNITRAKMHMNESAAQQASAGQHQKKAHKYMDDAIQAYSAADIQAPNGPATGKKADEGDLSTKGEEAIDFSQLLKAMSFSQ